ncbi:MAG: GNAT family N-acetyltransferase [Clostridia bacterium]|nr:GNAT family N-acetyltransferase [Clostridia bacterium]
MKAEIYNTLPEEAHVIRNTVFIEEQGFEKEFDSIDAQAAHILLYDSNLPAATCRIFWDNDMNSHVLGRLAVLKEYRGRGLGAAVVKEALDYVKSAGGKQLMLHSQCRAAGFYERLGFTAFGDIGYDEGCPHIWMKKEL